MTNKDILDNIDNKKFVCGLGAVIAAITSKVYKYYLQSHMDIDHNKEDRDEDWPSLDEDSMFCYDYLTIQSALKDKNLNPNDDLIKFFQKYYYLGSSGLSMILTKIF